MSPWLNLSNQQGGALDNYHMFVRPEMQRRDASRRQQYDINRQGVDIQSMRQSMSGVRQAAGMRPTGTGSMFMNYSHYYPNFGRR